MALIDDIKTMVMQRLDEFMPSDDSYNSIMQFDMDSLIDEAGRRVVLAAPLHLLTYSATQGPPNEKVPEDRVVVKSLPSNYLRAISAKLGDWTQTVYGNEILTPEHSLYARQANPMTSGGPAKPVVAIAHNRIEFYRAKEGSTNVVVSFEYFPNTKISVWESTTGSQPYPKTLIEPVAWQTVALLFEVMEEPQNAAVAQNRCNELLALEV